MDALLSATGVWKRFGGVAALRGADFSAPSGEIVGLLGANGAGKSTLVKIISGALAADAGDIRINGRRARWRRRATPSPPGCGCCRRKFPFSRICR